MCLGIPGQIVEILDREAGLATVDISGVRREVSVALVDEPAAPIEPGDWVLVHVGFALSRIDEDDAERDARAAAPRCRAAAGAGRDPPRDGRMSLDPEHCLTCSDEAVAARVRRSTGSRRWSPSTRPRERVAIDLVPDARPGDLLLCHAGIALERLEDVS